MPYKKTGSKYTSEVNNELSMRTLAVLADCPKALTIEQIKLSDIYLTGQTSQKMVRVLSELRDKGLI